MSDQTSGQSAYQGERCDHNVQIVHSTQQQHSSGEGKEKAYMCSYGKMFLDSSTYW